MAGDDGTVFRVEDGGRRGDVERSTRARLLGRRAANRAVPKRSAGDEDAGSAPSMVAAERRRAQMVRVRNPAEWISGGGGGTVKGDLRVPYTT